MLLTGQPEFFKGYEPMMDMSRLPEGIVYYIVFLFAATCHEAAHAWAAMRGGDLTAYHGGQVSLDPIPHIRRAPFGMVVLPILSVIYMGWPLGFASAPYDPDWAQAHPRRAALMSLAGPCANLALMLIAALAIHAGMALGFFYPPDEVSFGHLVGTDAGRFAQAVAFFIGAIFSMNLVLFVLNMLPLPPLDGSGAVPLLMSSQAARQYHDAVRSHPAFGIVGILIAWHLLGAIFLPVFLFAVNLLYWYPGGVIWLDTSTRA